MMSPNGNIFCLTGPLYGEFTGRRWIHRTKATDAQLCCFLWSAPWINGWVNIREAGDWRRHRSHYDVIVMVYKIFWFWIKCIFLIAFLSHVTTITLAIWYLRYSNEYFFYIGWQTISITSHLGVVSLIILQYFSNIYIYIYSYGSQIDAMQQFATNSLTYIH